MRRLIVDEPVSRAAVWSRRLGWFALVLAAMAFLLARFAPVEPTAVLAVLSAAFLTACTAILLAFTAFAIIWRLGRKGVGQAVGGLVLALLLLAYPGYLAMSALRLPLLSDVTTDIDDPPGFARTRAALAKRGGAIPADPGASVRARQEAAYRQLQPLTLEIEAETVYRLVLRAMQALDWDVIHRVPPGGRLGLGHIDAVVRSPILGFPDDLTVRIAPLAGQTRIDVRSASRVGRHDFGANLGHIEEFMQELQAQISAR